MLDKKFLSESLPFKIMMETTKYVVFTSNDSSSEALIEIDELNKCQTLEDFEELVLSKMHPVMDVLEELNDIYYDWSYEDDPMFGEDYGPEDELPF